MPCSTMTYTDPRSKQAYLELREELEDQFWAANGEPTEIQPYIVESSRGGMRKSWIYIMYEKDMSIKKKDEFD